MKESGMEGNSSLKPPEEQQAHSLLTRYLQAADEAEAQCFLDRLIEEFAQPILKGIVGTRYRVSLDALRGRTQTRNEQEASDAYSDATIQLISYLRKLRRQPQRDAIQNFRAYVAATTYRACDNLLRRKYPQRWSLKTKLRYLLSKQECFALWEAKQHETLCG